MTDPCPTTDCTGTLATRTSRRVGTETIERRRCCNSCEYEEIALVRPAKIISVRVVKTTTDFPQENTNAQ